MGVVCFKIIVKTNRPTPFHPSPIVFTNSLRSAQKDAAPPPLLQAPFPHQPSCLSSPHSSPPPPIIRLRCTKELDTQTDMISRSDRALCLGMDKHVPKTTHQMIGTRTFLQRVSIVGFQFAFCLPCNSVFLKPGS